VGFWKKPATNMVLYAGQDAKKNEEAGIFWAGRPGGESLAIACGWNDLICPASVLQAESRWFDVP
jgi:hypothetical protein